MPTPDLQHRHAAVCMHLPSAWLILPRSVTRQNHHGPYFVPQNCPLFGQRLNVFHWSYRLLWFVASALEQDKVAAVKTCFSCHQFRGPWLLPTFLELKQHRTCCRQLQVVKRGVLWKRIISLTYSIRNTANGIALGKAFGLVIVKAIYIL